MILCVQNDLIFVMDVSYESRSEGDDATEAQGTRSLHCARVARFGRDDNFWEDV